MKTTTGIITLLLLAAAALPAGAKSFSEMDSAEVSTLLAAAQTAAAGARQSASAKDADSDAITPVEVTARDLVTKIYGVLSTDLNHDECVAETIRVLSINPEDEESVVWLDADAGYQLDYYGMKPQCTAMARFNDSDQHRALNDFGFFFIFPFDPADKPEALQAQSDFSGALLQEMNDIGVDMGVNSLSDDIFETVGEYEGNLVDIRLLEDPGANHYLLMLTVEPETPE